MAIEVNSEGDTDISKEEGALGAVRPDEKPEALASDAEYVVYQGKAQRRSISAEDWANAGVESQGGVVWEKSNNFQVSVEEFSAKALQALRNDGSFSVPAAE